MWRFGAKCYNPGVTPDEIAVLVRDHTQDLLRAALGLGLPITDAEELVQDSFVAFLKAAERFEGRSSVKTFLFGILYNKALERGRKAARELATDPSDQIFDGRFNWWGHWTSPPGGPEKEADVKEIAELIAQCLEGLTPQQRAAFQLKEVDRELNPAICNILGVQDTHLRVLLFRARTKLRECIEGKWTAGA